MPVQLWTARLDRPLTGSEEEAMLRMVPPERRERILRMQHPEKRREPLCAYLLLRLALWQRFRWQELPEIVLSSRGKPGFSDHPEVQFNLSHTRGAVLVGLSDKAVGVDIERVRPVGRKLMERLAQTDSEEEFFRNWVEWEARSKRSGDGVVSLLRTPEPLRDGEFYYPVDVFPGYAAGTACGDREPPEILGRYSLDEIGGAL